MKEYTISGVGGVISSESELGIVEGKKIQKD